MQGTCNSHGPALRWGRSRRIAQAGGPPRLICSPDHSKKVKSCHEEGINILYFTMIQEDIKVLLQYSTAIGLVVLILD